METCLSCGRSKPIHAWCVCLTDEEVAAALRVVYSFVADVERGTA